MAKVKKEETVATVKEAGKSDQPSFEIHRIYSKDTSFESPETPGIFKENPQFGVNIDINTTHEKVEDGVVLVVLQITAEAKVNDSEKVAYIAEIRQAGIFTVKNFPEDQVEHVIHSLCPSILFPYASERVSHLVSQGGFPPLYLAPVNFEALFAQKKKQEEETRQ
jgi:preprotein translocase subunit SecB